MVEGIGEDYRIVGLRSPFGDNARRDHGRSNSTFNLSLKFEVLLLRPVLRDVLNNFIGHGLHLPAVRFNHQVGDLAVQRVTL